MSIFSEGSRNIFFEGVKPDIKTVITSLESDEAWTLIIEESPFFYGELSSVVSALANSSKEAPLGESHLYDRLIIALSSISFSYSIIALCHLDRSKTASGISISEKLVDHAFERSSDKASEVFAEARVIRDRVSLFIESGILVNMFSGLIKE